MQFFVQRAIRLQAGMAPANDAGKAWVGNPLTPYLSPKLGHQLDALGDASPHRSANIKIRFPFVHSMLERLPHRHTALHLFPEQMEGLVSCSVMWCHVVSCCVMQRDVT